MTIRANITNPCTSLSIMAATPAIIAESSPLLCQRKEPTVDAGLPKRGNLLRINPLCDLNPLGDIVVALKLLKIGRSVLRRCPFDYRNP